MCSVFFSLGTSPQVSLLMRLDVDDVKFLQGMRLCGYDQISVKKDKLVENACKELTNVKLIQIHCHKKKWCMLTLSTFPSTLQHSVEGREGVTQGMSLKGSQTGNTSVCACCQDVFVGVP